MMTLKFLAGSAIRLIIAFDAGLRTQRARGEPQIAGGGPIVWRRRYGRPPSKRDWNFVGLDGIRIPLERVESCSVP
jgi:hypothetical protein